jgi:uncharacterized protein YcgI (DUF1989 family)
MVKFNRFTAIRASIMAGQKKAASSGRVSIPARHAKAAFVKKGRRIKVINTHGTQDITSICGNKPRNAHFEIL